MDRPTRPCRHCGHAYQGRGIYADHGLAEHNLHRHEAVCLRQQRQRAAVENRKRRRISSRYRRRLERMAAKMGMVAPLEGQLGFPFEGVPAIVA